MALQKKDFIEIEFTGRIKDGEVFDSNVKKDLEKLNPDINPKPLIFALGEGMFLKGIDDFLTGKDIGKYKIELPPEKAFGPRIPEFVQTIPIKIFRSQNLNPVPGAVFNFDGRIAKILTVSGGRVMADFNNPLSGKIVVYDINVIRKVEDLNEKLKSFTNFLFRKEMNFSVKDNKITMEVEKNLSQFVKMFGEKFKDIFNLELKIKVIGVGGAGGNSLSRMREIGIKGGELIAVNTDAQDLLYANADQKILIGRELTQGLGAGSNPKVGQEAAKESESEIKKKITGSDMIFITCGLGGGTGTGAAPVVASIA